MSEASERASRRQGAGPRGDGSFDVIGAAIEVHRELGPGLLESAYRSCLVWELQRRGLDVAMEVSVPVHYRGRRIECGYRLDLLVEERLVVELKSVRTLDPVHVAQLLTYLKLSQRPLGLLINFNVLRLRDGIRRVIASRAACVGPPPP